MIELSPKEALLYCRKLYLIKEKKNKNQIIEFLEGSRTGMVVSFINKMIAFGVICLVKDNKYRVDKDRIEDALKESVACFSDDGKFISWHEVVTELADELFTITIG